MRLCDEYCERMGLGRLRLRHAPKFYLFFDGGEKLLSSKWISTPSSTGYYEFTECQLGRKVVVHSKEHVEWEDFEGFISSWLDIHRGMVFDKGVVFDLVWKFFVSRNERFLSLNYDPMTIYSTVDLSNPSRRSVAAGIVEETLSSACEAGHFWSSKASEIMSNYAHWLSD